MVGDEHVRARAIHPTYPPLQQDVNIAAKQFHCTEVIKALEARDSSTRERVQQRGGVTEPA